MKPALRKTLRILLLTVFLISTALFLKQQLENTGADASYDNALALALSGTQAEATAPGTAAVPQDTQPPAWVPAPVTDDPEMEALENIDLQALRSVNPEVIGWIRIPDTAIDYPIVQGEDNAFYLTHTWEGAENSVGSIFMEHRNSPDFTDFNTILYGHNMNNGSMFADICRYVTLWHWERHPYIYLVTDGGVLRYEIFSSYRAPVEGSAYGLSFRQMETRGNFMVDALMNSVIETGIEPELTDRILTLSTCSGTYDHRWIIQGRLKMLPAQPET